MASRQMHLRLRKFIERRRILLGTFSTSPQEPFLSNGHDMLTHFESVTQLDPKLGSGDELSVKKLNVGIQHVFGRYYGVLDTATVLRRPYDSEGVGGTEGEG